MARVIAESSDDAELRAVEAAQAAEVRAAMVVEADAAVVARAAELALVTARKDMQYGKNVSSTEQSVLEQSVRQTQADEKVAQALLSLLRAGLQALQLRRAD
jgi:hypothetical protein